MAEHVRQVADPHRAAEGGCSLDTHLQVAHDRLARDEELVHEDVPGSTREPPGGGQPAQALLVLGSHLEIVVDHRHLAVEEEAGVGRVGLHRREQMVDELDQPQAEGLERRVPLPVPVSVRHDVDSSALGHTAQVRALEGNDAWPAGASGRRGRV